MQRDIHHHISSCTSCAQVKVPRIFFTGKLMPLPMPQNLWSHIAVDFITDLPESLGNIMILVIIDWFLRSLHLIPLPGLPTAFKTAELLFTLMFQDAVMSEHIVSEWETEFTSRVWVSFMEKWGVMICLTSGYHPQCNGQVERANQEKHANRPMIGRGFSHGQNIPRTPYATQPHISTPTSVFSDTNLQQQNPQPPGHSPI